MTKRETKLVSVIVALVLAFVCAIGGTIAWLTANTQTVTNTFTVGNIDITLTETEGTAVTDSDGNTVADSYEFKMVPGNTINKDPEVTVKAGSEACWLYVKVEETDNVDGFLTYEMADGWKVLDAATGLYYYEGGVDALDAVDDITYSVLKDDQVIVNKDVTKEMMDALTADTLPNLKFTAYAIQKANTGDSALAAWNTVYDPDITTTAPIA